MTVREPTLSARDHVLQRVREALGPRPTATPATRGYRMSGEYSPGAPELLDLLVDRLVDYRAVVQRCAAVDLPTVAADVLLRAVPPGRLLVPPGIPSDWTGSRNVLRDDPCAPADIADLDTVAAVLTGCAVAVAETGTIVLDGGPDQGRRALSLVPDLHVCVVRADQVVQTVPEALRRLDARRPLTWISGPSATSDIELSRVEGVHGPRTLQVILVEDRARDDV